MAPLGVLVEVANNNLLFILLAKSISESHAIFAKAVHPEENSQKESMVPKAQKAKKIDIELCWMVLGSPKNQFSGSKRKKCRLFYLA